MLQGGEAWQSSPYPSAARPAKRLPLSRPSLATCFLHCLSNLATSTACCFAHSRILASHPSVHINNLQLHLEPGHTSRMLLHQLARPAGHALRVILGWGSAAFFASNSASSFASATRPVASAAWNTKSCTFASATWYSKPVTLTSASWYPESCVFASAAWYSKPFTLSSPS